MRKGGKEDCALLSIRVPYEESAMFQQKFFSHLLHEL